MLGIASAGATVAGPTPAVAAPARADWESTGLTQSVSRLFNPRSGALLAAGAGKLRRSDDGGTAWRDVPLPPCADLAFAVGDSYRPPHVGPGPLAVDPSNHDVLSVGAGGLNESVDGGATWTPLPTEGTVIADAYTSQPVAGL